MRMLSFYENRGGKNLSAEREHTLEKAKDILREKEGFQGQIEVVGLITHKEPGRVNETRSSSRSHAGRTSRKASSCPSASRVKWPW